MVCRLLIVAFLLAACASRPWTKQEKVLLVASCTATVADMTTTIKMLDDGNWEINPIMGKHPTTERIVITMTVVEVIAIILAHYFEGFRSWILGTKTAINTSFAIHNMGLD